MSEGLFYFIKRLNDGADCIQLSFPNLPLLVDCDFPVAATVLV